MQTSGSLFQDAANNTAGFSEVSQQVTKWARGQFYVATPTTTYSAASVLRHLIFDTARDVPVFRHRYFSFADQLDDAMLRSIPPSTGFWQLEKLFSSSESPAGAAHDVAPDSLVREIV